jgi:hypothetical protein
MSTNKFSKQPFLFFIFIFVITSSCKQKSPEVNPQNGTVIPGTSPKQMVLEDSSGGVYKTWFFTYDNQNRVTKLQTLNANGTITNTVLASYTSSNNFATLTGIDSSGNKTIQTYTYNSNGFITGVLINDTLITKYYYAPDNTTIQSKVTVLITTPGNNNNPVGDSTVYPSYTNGRPNSAIEYYKESPNAPYTFEGTSHYTYVNGNCTQTDYEDANSIKYALDSSTFSTYANFSFNSFLENIIGGDNPNLVNQDFDKNLSLFNAYYSLNGSISTLSSKETDVYQTNSGGQVIGYTETLYTSSNTQPTTSTVTFQY